MSAEAVERLIENVAQSLGMTREQYATWVGTVGKIPEWPRTIDDAPTFSLAEGEPPTMAYGWHDRSTPWR